MKRKEYTIKDIADELHVSTASVSRAVSGMIGVGDELRDKILAYCDVVGYPYKAKRNPDDRSRLIALILGDIRNPFYAELACTVQNHLAENNYSMMIYNSGYQTDNELHFIDWADESRFAGLILVTAQDEEVSRKLTNIRIPKVLVNRILPNYKGDSVLTDNFQAGYEATLHLINLGHRSIGFIGGSASSSAAVQRYDGFCQAMKNYNLPINDTFIFNSDLTFENGLLLSSDFVGLTSKPTAIVVINDMTAIGFISGLKDKGVRIPDDLSVVGFDDIPVSSLHDISLTTVDQHASDMGKLHQILSSNS